MGSFPSRKDKNQNQNQDHEKNKKKCWQAIQTPADYLECKPVALTLLWSSELIILVNLFINHKFISQIIHDYVGPPLRIIIPLETKNQFWRQETFVMPMSDFLKSHRVGKLGQFHDSDLYFMITWKSCDKSCFGILFFNIDQFNWTNTKNENNRQSIFSPRIYLLKNVFKIRSEAICRTTDMNAVQDFCSILVYSKFVNETRICDVCPIDQHSSAFYDVEFANDNFYPLGENICPIFKSGFLQLS